MNQKLYIFWACWGSWESFQLIEKW